MELRSAIRLQQHKDARSNREAEEGIKDRTLNRVGCNIGRNGIYYKGVGIWEVVYNGSPVYICKKHLNDIRFVRFTFAVNVETERRLQDVIKAIEEMVEDNIV